MNQRSHREDIQLGELSKVISVSKIEGLEQYEIAALVAVAQQVNDPEGGISAYLVRQDLEKAGFTSLAATLGLRTLLEMEMLESFEEHEYNGEPFKTYRLSTKGWSWLMDNKSKLTLKMNPPDDREIPF